MINLIEYVNSSESFAFFTLNRDKYSEGDYAQNYLKLIKYRLQPITSARVSVEDQEYELFITYSVSASIVNSLIKKIDPKAIKIHFLMKNAKGFALFKNFHPIVKFGKKGITPDVLQTALDEFYSNFLGRPVTVDKVFFRDYLWKQEPIDTSIFGRNYEVQV